MLQISQLRRLAKRPFNAVLYQIVRQGSVSHQRDRIAPQPWKLRDKRFRKFLMLGHLQDFGAGTDDVILREAYTFCPFYNAADGPRTLSFMTLVRTILFL